MNRTLNDKYLVEGTKYETTNSLSAIIRAKMEAEKIKQSVAVLLNAVPKFLVDQKGNLSTIN